MKRLLLVTTLLGQLAVGFSQENQDANSFEIHADDPVMIALDSLANAPYFEAASFSTDTNDLNIYGFSADTVPTYPDTIYAERLATLDAQTPFNLVYNDRVKAFIHLYGVKRREQTSRLLGLQHMYFPMMESMLDEYNMPYELKHLAIVESALNPRARSRAGAVGLWQFMYATGKMFGLQQNSYIDERMDPVKSTRAACEYMLHLYEIYGKWDLVLAAYNCGPGNVNKAMRRSGSRTGNYWDLYPYLPRETRGYVPAFIAVNYIMNYPSEHNLYPVAPDETYFECDTVHLKKPVDMREMAQKLDVPLEQLRDLNPGYKQDYVPVYSNKTSIFCMPKEAVGVFVSNEEAIYGVNEQKLLAENKGTEIKKFSEDRITYRVRSGDYLGKIAQQHHVSVSSIRRWNGLRNNNIRVGQRLVIYPNGNYTASKSSSSKPRSYSTNGDFVYYQIQSGDTLWDIARNRGTTVSELQRLNSDLSGSALKPGMKIIVGTAS